VLGTITLDLDADGRIVTVHNVANPDKLRDVAARTVHPLG
jgi:multisubunit Na+/H+ antiporter MnhE subunit